MADWYGSSDGYSRRSERDEDFEEEDVWSVVKEREDSTPNQRKYKEDYSSVSSSSELRTNSSPRMIPTATHEAKAAQQSSAPVNIPDWSKIYGKNTATGSWDDDGFVYGHGNGYRNHNYKANNDNDEEEEEEEGDEMIPPHEWIAKKLARSQISSFSVCEGIGRTLKGRDLSKLRNAILTKTGFLE